MEDMKITVMWKDTPTAECIIKNNDVNVEYFTDEKLITFFPRKKLDTLTVMRLLEGRCYPRNRDNIDEILKANGFDHYDVLGMVKMSHGVKRDDFTWFKFNDENFSFEDIYKRNPDWRG